MWFLYLVLNSLEVDPMYSTFSVEALYTTHDDLHLFGRMHSFLQLHGSAAFSPAPSLSIDKTLSSKGTFTRKYQHSVISYKIL